VKSKQKRIQLGVIADDTDDTDDLKKTSFFSYTENRQKMLHIK